MTGYWVYTITTPDGMVYVGMSGREYSSMRLKRGQYKTKSVQKYIDLWSWDNLEKRIVKEGIETKMEAQVLEEELRSFCELNGVVINKIRSGCQCSKGKHDYYIKNKDKYRESDRRNYAIHREYYLERKSKWRKENSERANEYSRRYREKKKLLKQIQPDGCLKLF